MKHDKGLLDRSFWAEKILPLAIEYGIYLYILLMFAGKFGTFREIGLYAPPVLWLTGCLIKGNFDLQWREPVFICLIIFSLSAVISSFFSVSPVDSFIFFKKEHLKILLLYIVVSTAFAHAKKLNRLATFLALTGILYLVSGWYRISEDLLIAGSINYEALRNYATIFIFFLPFIILKTIEAERLERIFWLIPLIGSFTGILVIGVRGSWLALFGIFCIWMFTSKSKFQGYSIIFKTSIAFVIISILIITVFLLFPVQYKLVKDHSSQKIQLLLRFEAWENFLKMSGRRFLFGHGLDDRAMSEHYRAFYKSIKGDYPTEEKPTTPHNQFIKISYQQGIVGLASYLSLLSVVLIRIIKRFYIDNLTWFSFIGIAIVSVMIGEYVIRCLTEDRSLVPVGILIGMAGAFLSLKNRNDYHLSSS
ncbi:MAG: O-antigen ligase family protein [Nitrospirae bacterium]|jgi:O-antigen ligase|nr:O-antigen ligase family protein [Nitrospirota bacterium]